MSEMLDVAAGRGVGAVQVSFTRELIARASRVSIFDVLEDFFGLRPPRSEGWKGDCPFSFEHPDGGVTKGFRTYPATNSGYCYVMHGWMDPIRIMCIREESKPVAAARRLLEHYGLPSGQSWQERSHELIESRQSRRESLGSPTWAAHALQVSLEREGEYLRQQFETEVAETVDACLQELDGLMRMASTVDEDLREWLRRSRERVMESVEVAG